jgi:hypothetical protein
MAATPAFCLEFPVRYRHTARLQPLPNRKMSVLLGKIERKRPLHQGRQARISKPGAANLGSANAEAGMALLWRQTDPLGKRAMTTRVLRFVELSEADRTTILTESKYLA